MSDDSTRQEFLAELESILESDEAYGSNLQILTYSLKDETINGKFKDSWNNRVYEFIIDVNGISYKPAAKLDSISVDDLPTRFDVFSEGYGSLFEDIRLDRNQIGKRVKKPKCGAEGYGCGFSCIGLLKTCRILSSGKKTRGESQGKAIGKERLSKLIDLSVKLAASGDQKKFAAVNAVGARITSAKNKYQGEGRNRLVQRQITNKEKQSAEEESKIQKKSKTKLGFDQTTNSKTHSIKTQKEFEDVFLRVVDKLRKDDDDDVPIHKVREAIGELVSRDKFNQYVKDLQANDNVLLYGGSGGSQGSDYARQIENSITTNTNGLRFYIKLEDQAKNRIKDLSPEKQAKIDEQLDNRPDLDPLGTARQYVKGSRIKSQKEFEEVTEKIRKALNDEFNYDDLVPITKIRDTLKERVSSEDFNKMMLDLQANSDDYQLIGHGREGEKVPEELERGAVISTINGPRHYLRKTSRR
jgi:hypothetical protein